MSPTALLTVKCTRGMALTYGGPEDENEVKSDEIEVKSDEIEVKSDEFWSFY